MLFDFIKREQFPLDLLPKWKLEASYESSAESALAPVARRPLGEKTPPRRNASMGAAE
jgi:hypothetical protein